MKRVDRASRVIKASQETIYRAFVDQTSLLSWLPPKGMRARFDFFDARVGGGYRMALAYDKAAHATRGKTSEHEDVVEVEFAELVQNERVVQLVKFESDDPSFAGTMRMTWSLSPVADGTEVTIACEDVPEGIGKADHDVGLQSSLSNLAAFTE
ncbi:MAG: Aha1 domain family protein [Labilithrix sp.]|jgi:uncharacterized protein YndB with AHSA1/START domain|nr:Aha1 domain family protein [Labilithrix sp.]